MEWGALFLSFKLASVSTILLLIFGLPLAFYLARNKSSLASGLEAFLSLPLVLPPTVLGFYLLLLLSSVKLAFTFPGMIIASVIYSLPFALQPFISAFRSLDSQWLERSWVLGESKVMTFFRIALPLAKEGIFAGAILTFAHTLGEFGVVLMIGGNIPDVSRTLSISLYDQVESFDYHRANQTAAFLLVSSLVALISVNWLRRRGEAR